MTDHDTSAPPAGPPSAYWTALGQLLRPLVRGMIAMGVTFPQLSDLLKAIYVEVAAAQIGGPRSASQSRVSIMTGVHRKHVRRLLAQPTAEAAAPATASLGTRLVGLWTGSPQFRDEQGAPRPLPRQSGPGQAVSFETLVEAVSKDVRSRAVLDEWLRLGIVTVSADDHVRLNTDAFVPSRGFAELAYYYGRNLRDHIAAGTHNLLGERPPFLERAVFYDRLSPGSVTALAALATEAGREALRAVNAEALERADKDEGHPGATRHITFGVYFFSGEEAGTSADAPPSGRDEHEAGEGG